MPPKAFNLVLLFVCMCVCILTIHLCSRCLCNTGSQYVSLEPIPGKHIHTYTLGVSQYAYLTILTYPFDAIFHYLSTVPMLKKRGTEDSKNPSTCQAPDMKDALLASSLLVFGRQDLAKNTSTFFMFLVLINTHCVIALSFQKMQPSPHSVHTVTFLPS